jgi:hypothetical protein
MTDQTQILIDYPNQDPAGEPRTCRGARADPSGLTAVADRRPGLSSTPNSWWNSS